MKIFLAFLLIFFTAFVFNIESGFSEEGFQEKYRRLDQTVREFSSEGQAITNENVTMAKTDAENALKLSSEFKNDWSYGNVIHHSNIVLGRVALFNNDIKSAEVFLLAASDISGSPQLKNFGPNMCLAKELLKKGRKEVVLKYLEKCLKFWSSFRSTAKTNEWKKSIEKGEVPDFKTHLYY